MKDKILFISLFITLFVGCGAPKNSPALIPTQEIPPFKMPPTWTPTVTATSLLRTTPIVDEAFTPVRPVTSSNPTTIVQILSTQTPTVATQILLTQTPTLVDVESLPKLSEVVISSIDIDDKFSWNPVILATDATNELRDTCLWDCVKYRYSLKEGSVTIMLLRAGDRQKAETVAENLRKSFLKSVEYEYTVDDLSIMHPKAWALIDAASNVRDYRTGAAGIAHGSIVILVTYSENFCGYTSELGRYCEGNLMMIAWTATEFLNMQIKKLEIAGYPK